MAAGSGLRSAARVALWGLFALSCAAIAAHAFGYLYVEINLRNPFHRAFASAGVSVPLHFFGAGLALLVAPLQWLGGVRRRWPRWHRMLGWLYVLAVLLAGSAGLLLAPRAQGGWSTGASFLLLALLWLAFTAFAVIHAIRRRFEQHRRWMLRSVALTFAAVTLRIYLGFGIAALRLDFATAYLLAAWLCWTLNLLAVELWLRWRQTPATAHAPDRRWASDPSNA